MTDENADTSAPQTLYLIDGFAQMFRAYHAIRTAMASPVTKEPTNATFGYVGMLLKVLREYRPDYLAVAVDVAGDRGTFRTDLYPEYKANREPPPMDFRPQVTRCMEITERMNIPVIGKDRFEADDVLATIVTRLAITHPDLHIRIISKDKDLEQLLGDHVEMFDVHKDIAVTVESLKEKKGITPEQVIDVLALMGDNSDNVPGVPGIGPKTASQLMQQYGTIDNLLDHLDELKGKRRENLEASRELIPLSRELVTLVRDVDCEFDLDAARVNNKQMPVDELVDLFQTLGFTRYQDDLRVLVHGQPEPTSVITPASLDDGAGGLFAEVAAAAGNGNPANVWNEPKRGTYRLILTEAQLVDLVAELKAADLISIDTETTSANPMMADLCGISVSVAEGTGAYIPIRSPEPESHLDEKTVIDALRPLLEDANRPKCGQNIKYDMLVLRRHGIRMKGVTFDTMIASFLVDSTRPSHGMNALAQAILNYRCIPLSHLLGKITRSKTEKTFDEVPLDQAGEYAAEDADVTLRLMHYFDPQLGALKLRSLFDDVEMPLVEVLADMEFNGIRVDPDILDEQRLAIIGRIRDLRCEILDQAPHDFNPDSPKQLAGVLFNKPEDDPPGFGLKVAKRRKTGPSTDIEVLEKLAADPRVKTTVPQLIVEYRQLTKLVNTYLEALKECIHPETGRIHASFHQTVAATGRLSSSSPNLQNIPIRTDVGRQIRAAFIAPPGFQLITADYSQIELRLLAHLSDDESLKAAFRNDEDIHSAVAAQIYGVPLEDVSRSQRDSAKMVNFGIIYGITAFGLSRRLGEDVSNEDAARIITDYKARYPGIDRFLETCVSQAKRFGYVETMLHRRRAVPQVHSRNPQERAMGERMAINSVVQGSAADLIKLAMIDLHRRLPDELPGARMLLQIHDELVFEVPEKDVERGLAFITDRMEHAMELKVPLKVGAASAANWLEGK